MDPTEPRMGEPEGAPKRVPRPPPFPRRDNADARIMAERDQHEREMSEERDLTDQERLEMFREALYQSVLPDLPYMPGYHLIWLTTTNPRDSIGYRLRLGYELLRVEQVPGWEGIGVQAAGISGVVGVNEMVAARIPMRLYHMYLREVHETAPYKEEMKLRAQVQQMRAEAERDGTVIDEGDGMAAIVQRAAPMPMPQI